MLKKGQGISMNVIIIAAIALLVLVILSVIFLSNMAGFQSEANSCERNGAVCENPENGDVNTGSCPEPGQIRSPVYKCQDPQQICCLLTESN